MSHDVRLRSMQIWTDNIASKQDYRDGERNSLLALNGYITYRIVECRNLISKAFDFTFLAERGHGLSPWPWPFTLAKVKVVVLQCPAGQVDVYSLTNYTASLVHAALNVEKDRLVAFDVHNRCATEGKCHLRVIAIA